MNPGPLSPALESLAAVWRARAEELRAAGNSAEAAVFDRLEADVRRALAISPGRSVTPLATDRLWTQHEAAYYLGVSVRYLRESSCPKVLLPGAGKRGQPLVRYEPAAVMAWKDAWSTSKRGAA